MLGGMTPKRITMLNDVGARSIHPNRLKVQEEEDEEEE